LVAEVAPPTEVVAQLKLGLPTAHTVNHLNGADLVGIDAFPVEVELAPEEEELLAHLVGDVTVDDRVALVVLVHHVEGLAVPDAQMEALSIYHVVAEDALQLLHFRLQIDHDFGGLGDLLQAQLFLAPDVFVEDLEEKLCYESLHVLLVRMLGIDPFNVHLADISFILFAELVHPAD